MRHLRSNAVAYLALLIALGGTSYAASHLSRGSVTSREVKNHSLKKRDLAAGVRAKGDTGPAGPKGEPGAKGDSGAAGTAIVARARFTGDQVLANDADPIPLTGAAWTQPAGQLDIPYGAASLDVPSSGGCGGGQAVIAIKLGNAVLLEGTVPASAAAANGVTIELHQPKAIENTIPALFEPATAQQRTVQAVGSDGCDQGEHFHVRTVAVDIVGVS